MFKLIILFALIAVITAKPAGLALLPAQVNLLSEKTIEHHGIHATGPLIHPGPAILPIAQSSSVAVKVSSTPQNLPLEKPMKSEMKDGTLADMPLSIDKIPEKKLQLQPTLPLTYAPVAPFYHAAPVALTKFASPSILETHHLAYSAPFYYALPHTLIGDRSISSHGHSVIHWG